MSRASMKSMAAEGSQNFSRLHHMPPPTLGSKFEMLIELCAHGVLGVVRNDASCSYSLFWPGLVPDIAMGCLVSSTVAVCVKNIVTFGIWYVCIVF